MTVAVFTGNSREVVPSLSLVKFVALGASWRVTNKASVIVVANVCSTYRSTQKTLIDVDASFPIASKFVAFGAKAQVRSLQVSAVVRANWLDFSAFVDVNAGSRESIVVEARKTSDSRSEGNISRLHWEGIFDWVDFSDNNAGQPVINKPIACQSDFVEMESNPAGLPWNTMITADGVDTNLRLKASVVPDPALVDIFTKLRLSVVEHSWSALLWSLRPQQAFQLPALTAIRNRRMEFVNFITKAASYAASVIFRRLVLTK